MNNRQKAFKMVEEYHRKVLAQHDAFMFELRKNAAYAEAEKDKELAEWDLAKKKAFGQDCAIEEEVLKEKKNRWENALKALGYDVSETEYKWNCEECRDTGKNDGGVCNCVEKLRIDLEIDENPSLMNIPNKLEEIDFAFYGENEKRYRKYADYLYLKLFSENKNFVTVFGKTGTGKTYFANVAAKEILLGGGTVKIINAIRLNKLFLEYHCAPIERKNELWNSLTDSDIMIIDDLGVEQLFNNVTLPYLYEIFEERASKQTIFTTNLDLHGIEDRYGQRIFSRLCDKTKSVIIPLEGNDYRFKV